MIPSMMTTDPTPKMTIHCVRERAPLSPEDAESDGPLFPEPLLLPVLPVLPVEPWLVVGLGEEALLLPAAVVAVVLPFVVPTGFEVESLSIAVS